MTKHIRTIAPILLLAVVFAASACGPGKPNIPAVPQTPYTKALTGLEDVSASTRAFSDGYMSYFRKRVAAIKADVSLSAAQRKAALQSEKDKANAINEIYGKATAYQTDAFTIIQTADPANFTGSGVTQTLTVANKIVALFNDSSIINITDPTVLALLAAVKTGLQVWIGILQQQGGANVQ